jgi:hypothetical protein
LDSARNRVAGVTKEESVPPLPEDVSTYIPEVPYKWLKKCLTDEEILKNRIGWSQGRLSLVFPVFDQQGKLLIWQSRYFGPLGNFPKYLTKGYKGDILHVLGEHSSNRVVLVEDLISAIVVSRVENSMPLWGSTIHLKTLRQLARYYGQVSVWLDEDVWHSPAKVKSNLESLALARLLFDDVNIIRTDEDPKYQQQEQLAKILGEPLDKRDKPRYNLN